MKISNEVSIEENFLKYGYLTENVFNKPIRRFFCVYATTHYTTNILFLLRAATQKFLSAFCMHYNNQHKCIFVQSSYTGLGFGSPQPIPSASPVYIFPVVCRTNIKKG